MPPASVTYVYASPVMGCFNLITSNSMAQHAPAMLCCQCQRSQKHQIAMGRALAWNLISFCPQSCHLLLQLIPANSTPAHVSMFLFCEVFFFRALRHLADFVCLLGMHPSLEHTLQATGRQCCHTCCKKHGYGHDIHVYRQQDCQLHPAAGCHPAYSAAWCHTTYQAHWLFCSSFTKRCCCAVLC
jgi:hypothetical protein